MWDSSFWETTLGLRCLTDSSGLSFGAGAAAGCRSKVQVRLGAFAQGAAAGAAERSFSYLESTLAQLPR